jgi:hypothetical protein
MVKSRLAEAYDLGGGRNKEKKTVEVAIFAFL